MSENMYRPGQPYQFFAQEMQEANYHYSMGLNPQDTFLGRHSPQREENVYVMAPFGYAQETRPTTPTPNYVPYSGPIPFFGFEQQDLAPEKKTCSLAPQKYQELLPAFGTEEDPLGDKYRANKLKRKYTNNSRSRSRDKAEIHSPHVKDRAMEKNNDVSYSRGHSRNREPKQKFSDEAIHTNRALNNYYNYNMYNSTNKYNNYNSSYNSTYSNSNNNNNYSSSNNGNNNKKCYLKGHSRNESPKLNCSVEDLSEEKNWQKKKKEIVGNRKITGQNNSGSGSRSASESRSKNKSQSPQYDRVSQKELKQKKTVHLVDKSTSSHDQSPNKLQRKREKQKMSSESGVMKNSIQQPIENKNRNEMNGNQNTPSESKAANTSTQSIANKRGNEMHTRTQTPFYDYSTKMKPPWQPDKVIIDMQKNSRYDQSRNEHKTLPRIPVPLLDEGFDAHSELQPWPSQKPKEVQKFIPPNLMKKMRGKRKQADTNLKQTEPKGVYDGPNWTYEVIQLAKPAGIYEKSTKWSYNRPSDVHLTVGNMSMATSTTDMTNSQGVHLPSISQSQGISAGIHLPFPSHFGGEVQDFFPPDFYWENENYNISDTHGRHELPRERNCQGMSEEWEARNIHEEKNGKPLIRLRDVNEDAEPAFLRPDIGVYRRRELDPIEEYGRTKGIQKKIKVTNFKKDDKKIVYDPRFRTVDPCNRLNPPYSKHVTKRELPPPRANMDSPKKKDQIQSTSEQLKRKEPRPEMDFTGKKFLRAVLPCNDRNFRVPKGAHPELLMEHRNFCQKPYREPVVLCDAAAMANIGRHLIWSEDNQQSPCELRTTVAPKEDKKMIKFQILEGGIYKADTAAQTAETVNRGVLCEFTANVPAVDSNKVSREITPQPTAPLPPITETLAVPLAPADVTEEKINVLVPVKSKSNHSIALGNNNLVPTQSLPDEIIGETEENEVTEMAGKKDESEEEEN